MSASHRFRVSCPRGFEQLLGREIEALDGQDIAVGSLGLDLVGPLALGYRACLWSRIANRILVEIARGQAADTDDLYAATSELSWREHLPPGATFAVTFTERRSTFDHTYFAALRVKDAIVDQLRDSGQGRPDVDPRRPDVRIYVHAEGEELRFSIDLGGGPLHRRGYRRHGGRAPLQENIAAALLLRAGWPELAAAGGPLVDPVCGSGTFLIEGALMAAEIAPGLLRATAEPGRWPGHDAAEWRREVEAARARGRSLGELPTIVGGDVDPEALRAAHSNARDAGLADQIRLERADLVDAGRLCPTIPPGLVIANPPYGERLGQPQRLKPLYASLGETLRQSFGGWRAGVLTAEEGLAASLGLRAQRRYRVDNGDLECRFYTFRLLPPEERASRAERRTRHDRTGGNAPDPAPLAGEFANRLRKNRRGLDRWARREGISCYRLYDADVPQYAVAVDLYDRWAHVQEHAPPATVSEQDARRRREAMAAALPDLLDLPAEDVFFKTRERQRGRAQYDRREVPAALRTVQEGGYTFLVNLSEYLDTGLFLDGRLVRAAIRERADGRRFLNLFAYTSTATVYAAKGGAAETTSVDMSATYLSWAERNLAHNGLSGKRHRLERANCLDWLQRQPGRYDLIYCDPPTFSNSKDMSGSFEVQRDHGPLIHAALRCLAPQGILLFACNRRGFKLDRDALEGLTLEDLSASTLPRDFKRRAAQHHVWQIQAP